MSNTLDKHLYDSRKEFSIIALTGIMGSGYKELIEIMRMSWEELRPLLRNPEHLYSPDFDKAELKDINNSNKDANYEAISYLMNNRKYTICYKYMEAHYTSPYEVVKYNKVLWLYSLKKLCQKEQYSLELFKEDIHNILKDKYAPHRTSYEDDEVEDTTYTELCNARKQNNQLSYLDYWDKINAVIENALWESVFAEIMSLPDIISESRLSSEDKKKLHSIFFGQSAFVVWYNRVNTELIKLDYYCSCFLYHRLGTCIRATGNPLTQTEGNREFFKKNEYLFDIVKLLVTIIKIHHKEIGDNPCRICIDALHNSLEARYLQERFTAFYFMAVNNANYKNYIENVIQEKMCNNGEYTVERDKDYLDTIVKNTLLLGATEAKSGIKDEELAVPDLENCVASAEIHLGYIPTPTTIQKLNIDGRGKEDAESDLKHIGFYYLAEQWMKYACLIQRPGLITPSTDERCMEIAHTAKFNSGCISRQVGAVITNKFGSIRTIGWNDAPYGQVPCAYRDLRDLINGREQNKPNKLPYLYSEFESENSSDVCLYKEKCFKQKINEIYGEKIDAISMEAMKGMPFPFCFKEYHTTWLEKEKGNQFHQRAIHAEENAMMQMVKYGGEALNGGVIYVTASPCEICSKKLYQIGVRKIVYIDPYPGIARKQIIANGYRKPELVNYLGAYGATYYKLFTPFISYKDEIHLRLKRYNINWKN